MKFLNLVILVLSVSSVSHAGLEWGKCHYLGGSKNIAAAKAQYEANMKSINETYGTNLRHTFSNYLDNAVAANRLTPRSRAQEAVNLAIGEQQKREALHLQYAQAAADTAYERYMVVYEANTFSCLVLK